MTEPSLLLHPAIPLLLGAVLVRVLPRRAGHVVMVVAPLLALAQISQHELGTALGLTWMDFELTVLRVDGLSRPFGIVFALVALLAGVYGIAQQRAPERTAALVYAGAALGVVYAGDLLTFFLFWETKAVASAFVILARRTARSGRSGMRYLFVHVAAGKVLLAGILWHVARTGSFTFEAFEPGAPTVVMLVGIAVSVALPPLHAWLPDAYPEATVAGTVFLSAFTTKAAVYALARGFAGTDALIWLGVAMAIYGVVFAMLENDIRRLLAYHIVSQVGFMVTGVGIGTEAAINGAVAHAFAHILYKGLLLMGAGAVLYATGRRKLHQLGGIANRMRPALALYLVGAVSISSVPLFSGFVSKELVIESASAAGLYWVLYTLKIVSVGTFLSTGLKLPYAAWVGEAGLGPRDDTGAPFRVGRVATSMYVAMGAAALLNLAIGVMPNLLYDLLPFTVDYSAYSAGKVNEKLQMLLFTGLGFWLLLAKLGPKALVSVDADWLYRRGPDLVRDLGRRGRRREAPVATARSGHEPAPQAALQAARTAVLSRFGPVEPGRTPPVFATWALGAVVLAASVLLVFVSIVP